MEFMIQCLNCERNQLYEDGNNSQITSVTMRVINKELIEIKCEKCDSEIVVNNYGLTQY